MKMKLYLAHCGFYDKEVCEGLFESHVNFFVVAPTLKAARDRVTKKREFILKHMHVDGLQEISWIDGYALQLTKEASFMPEVVAREGGV